MEHDVDTKSYILRVSLDTFLKETIEIQPLEQELRHSLRNIERIKILKTLKILKTPIVFKVLKVLTLFIDLLIY